MVVVGDGGGPTFKYSLNYSLTYHVIVVSL